MNQIFCISFNRTRSHQDISANSHHTAEPHGLLSGCLPCQDTGESCCCAFMVKCLRYHYGCHTVTSFMPGLDYHLLAQMECSRILAVASSPFKFNQSISFSRVPVLSLNHTYKYLLDVSYFIADVVPFTYCTP